MSDTAQTEAVGERKMIIMQSHSSIAAVFRSRRHDLFCRKLAEDDSPSNVAARAMGGNNNGIGKETSCNWMRQGLAGVRRQNV
ncbi:MAG: hypothetical protein ABSF86_23585 [Steroidobacteraceae bacterium]|jgi:hypothetical protein